MKIKHFILMAVVALIAIACGNMDNPLEVINNSDNNQDPTIVDTTTPIVTSIGIKDVNGNSLPSLSITIPEGHAINWSNVVAENDQLKTFRHSIDTEHYEDYIYSINSGKAYFLYNQNSGEIIKTDDLLHTNITYVFNEYATALTCNGFNPITLAIPLATGDDIFAITWNNIITANSGVIENVGDSQIKIGGMTHYYVFNPTGGPTRPTDSYIHFSNYKFGFFE